MERQHARPTVLVTGDVIIDWNLARTKGSPGGARGWNTKQTARAYSQPGGPLLLADLLGAVSSQRGENGTPAWRVLKTGAPTPGEPIVASDSRFHHAYATWSRFESSTSDPKAPHAAWRSEEFLGLDQRPDGGPASGSTGADASQVPDDSVDPDLLVIDDAGLGYRDRPDLWPASLQRGPGEGWIVLKMVRPFAQGDLWAKLVGEHAGRLVLVTTVDDLRLAGVHISRELSWERTAQDVVRELFDNQRMEGLARCAHSVISFGGAGALLVSHHETTGQHECRLVFDPAETEGTWSDQHQGHVFGYTICQAVGIVSELLANPRDPDLVRGLERGLTATRALHWRGYGDPQQRSALDAGLAFPFEDIATVLEGTLPKHWSGFTRPDFASVTVPIPRGGGRGDEPVWWSILGAKYATDPANLVSTARKIVSHGADSALSGVPLGHFGDLLTVDRQEIESYRSIGALVREYDRDPAKKRPLSIAVFGQPGSGKSFGITELATSLLPGKIEKREFNLSQFDRADALLDALHQVRDVGLSGKLPLVFWDEFDTRLAAQELGWLRYFLAPMQDGRFQQGQISHPIGPAIFVFAGGTSHRMSDFLTASASPAVKGRDFVSRLKGYIDILGPNPRHEGGDAAKEGWDGESSSAPRRELGDPQFVIRRAILLRGLLERHRKWLFRREDGAQILSIDSGVLDALLKTVKYKHGARSMESIIAMSLLAGRERFERSSLPAADQLELHVDPDDFSKLLRNAVE
jgi:hypothetical protein